MLILKIVNAFFLLIIIGLFLGFLLNSVLRKINIFGNPPVNKYIFILGKSSNFSCWGIFIFMTVYSFFNLYNPPFILFGLSTLTLILASILIFLSFKHLGDFNKFGLPAEKTVIIDNGIYSFSRNPMYLGFYFLNMSSALYFPHFVNIVLAVTGIIVHHFIALAEEKYMEQEFGKDWQNYKSRVGRYI